MSTRLLIFLFFVFFIGLARADDEALSPMMQGFDDIPMPLEETIDDPWESLNRPVFKFNDWLDTYALKPVSTLYLAIVPKPLTKGIHNVYTNMGNLQNIGNDLLQAHFYQATSDSWRLLINTTVGIGGAFDVASHIGLDQNNQDFGLTLAEWGYHDSRYVVLPFFGPSTLRDAMGMPVDMYIFSPYPYIGIDDRRKQYMLALLGLLDKRVQLLQYEDVYQRIALDRYTFVRDTYLQHRATKIEHNKALS